MILFGTCSCVIHLDIKHVISSKETKKHSMILSNLTSYRWSCITSYQLAVNRNLVAILQILVMQQLYLTKAHTHSISQRAVTCLSTTCFSFTGSPSSCCRSPSPNREPRPIICLFLWNTRLHVIENPLIQRFCQNVCVFVVIILPKQRCYTLSQIMYL